MKEQGRVIENKALRETLYHYRVPPGLDLYVLPRPAYGKKYAIFSTRFGSVDNHFRLLPAGEETMVPDGVAHFLEHKLFESEKGSVFDRFAALGASANAYTSFTRTTYLFSCTANFAENFSTLLDFVQEPYFTAETVKKEQGIIGQEIRMYEDNPHWRVFFNLLEALYCEHPVRRDIAGTVESISRITAELLHRCYAAFYHPTNMAIFAVGALDPAEVAAQVAANLAPRGYGEQKGIERFFPAEPSRVDRPRAEQKLVVSEPIFFLGFKDNGAPALEGRELLRREIHMELLLDILFGASEQLYNDLYRADLIDDDFGAEYTAEDSFAYTIIGGETKDPHALYEEIMKALARLKNKGITVEQFERHRRRILGHYIKRFNSLEFIANNYLAYRFREADLFELPALLQQAGRSETLDLLAECLDPARHALSLVLPQESEGK